MKSVEKKLSPEYKAKNSSHKTLNIKFGSRFYKMNTADIAYIYKKEGLCFVVDKFKSKLPILITDINEILNNGAKSDFVQIDDFTFINRNTIRLIKKDGKLFALASNDVYKDTFLVPHELSKKIETKFPLITL